MLKKVMKYEFLSAARMLGPLFGLLLLAAATARLAVMAARLFGGPPAAGVALALCSALLGFASLAVLILTLVVLVVRFYTSLTRGEAYLTFMLPVKPSTHLAGRMLTGLCTLAAAFATLLLGWFLFGFRNGFSAYAGQDWDRIYFDGVAGMPESMLLRDIPAGYIVAAVAAFILLVLLGVFFQLMQIYTAIALGTRFPKNRLLVTFLLYYGINLGSAFAMALLQLLVLGGFIASLSGGFFNIPAFFSTMAPLSTLLQVLGVLFGTMIVCVLLLIVVYYLLARRTFTHRLNLE